uniref:S8 family serine peptidase n=1 Tax=Bacillus TaxID=1386 RepID=UPI0024B9369D|nr:S8 family serine peptidase [Bacillus cereus]WHS75936.1 S8 family serine peptidase [Bacillus cereus]
MIKKGQLLIKFYEQVNSKMKKQIHTQFGGKKIEEVTQIFVELIEVPAGEETKYKNLYEQHPDVQFVEYNVFRNLYGKSCMCSRCKYRHCGCKPNDPYYEKKIETSEGLQNQWGLQRINPEQAFCEVKNTKPVAKIAVLDSGIDPNHPDLKEKIIDPINVGPGKPEEYMDTVGHGTFVAGIAAAITNNQIGIASASGNTAYIVPVKVGGETLETFAIIKGILYALEKEVDVINMSFGSPSYSQLEQLALELAWKQGIILVAAAGNEGYEQPSYPAAYNFVLAVSATDQTNRLSPFSNWGSEIGITAPGTAIVSTAPTYTVSIFSKTNYDASDGTSFSAPFVSGVAGMLRAIKSAASNQEVIQAIQRSAHSIDTRDKKWDPFYGYGLLNVSAAVQEIKCPQIPYGEYYEILGSFYGQVVNSEGSPMGELPVIVVDEHTKKIIKEYQTKFITCGKGEEAFIQSDGMFRLFNLPGGNYQVQAVAVYAPPKEIDIRILIESLQLIPGSDTYIKVILPKFDIEGLQALAIRFLKISKKVDIRA